MNHPETPKKRTIHWGRLAGLCAAAISITAVSVIGFYNFGRAFYYALNYEETEETMALAKVEESSLSDSQSDSAPASLAKAKGCVPADGTTSCFTFMGVGDNLIHENIFEGDDPEKTARNFVPMYQNITPYTQAADLAYINFETLCAGDEFGFSGYPDFNAPSEIIDALDASGFDWFSLASNHCLDRYPEGLLAELKDIKENHSDIVYTGVYLSEEDAQKPIVLDVNGIKVGLATFAYGLNGRDKPEGYEWMIDLFQDNYGTIDYDLLDRRMEELNACSDVQLITMHWGVEYNNEADELQQSLAQYLHEKGADVIIGTHPHVIAPAEILKTGDQETLVYYSLGNFISNQADMPTMVGGMAQFQLNYNPETKKIVFTDTRFTPTITWFDSGDHVFRVTTIHEYTDEMASTHGLQVDYGQDMSKANIVEYVQSVMQNPDGIEIVLDDSSSSSSQSEDQKTDNKDQEESADSVTARSQEEDSSKQSSSSKEESEASEEKASPYPPGQYVVQTI